QRKCLSSDYSPSRDGATRQMPPKAELFFGAGPYCRQQSSRHTGARLPGRSQLDPESASPARPRFNPDLPAHPFDACLHECKSYAATGVLLLAVQALEDLEDPGVLRRIDADAIVLHPEAHATRIAALRADLHVGPRALGHNLSALER